VRKIKGEKMKKIVFGAVFAALIISVLVTVILAASVDITVELSTGQELISMENKFYLPSSADVTSVKIKLDGATNEVTYGDGQILMDGDSIDLTPFRTTDKYHYECYVVEFKKGTEKTTYTFYKADSLSAVYINTSIGINNFKVKQQKDNFTKVSIVNKDGSYEYQDTALTVTESKVRGNTTQDSYKKPYQIKFSEKHDLFGLGKAKTWILLANYLDQSYLRNATMFELAERLGMNASDYTSVDVYVDGYYEGVYLLCEKVQIQEKRVNIRDLEKEIEKLMGSDYGRLGTTVVTKGDIITDTYLTEYKYYNTVLTPDDITGGYLIELDNTNKGNRANMDECYFITDSGNYYVIKSPEYCSKEQMEYIAGMFSEMEEAFSSADGKNRLGKHYSEYMDVDSFAYGYIMCEYGRTYDAGSNSVYFHKDADKNGVKSKIVKGPLWDCDNSLANIVRGNAHLTDNLWAANRTPWNMLTKHEDFMAVVAEKYAGIYDTIYDMIDAGGFLDQQIEEIGSSVAMDRIRNHLNTKNLWPLNTYTNFTGKHYDANTSMIHWFNRPQIPESEWAFPTYLLYSDGLNVDTTTVIGNLRTHMSARADWLAHQFGSDVEFRTRVDHVYDGYTDAICNECGYERELPHTYTDECDEKCDGCGYTRIAHVYGSVCDKDCDVCGNVREVSELHLYSHSCDTECNLCGHERNASDHSYSNDCDPTCNSCGAERQVEGHKFDSVCDNDCNKCGATRIVPGHQGGEATCKVLAVCTLCGKAYGQLVPHSFGDVMHCDDTFHWKLCTMCNQQKIDRQRHNLTAYVYDETEHYKICTICKNYVGRSDHIYDNGCDKICNECGARRDIDHQWDEGQIITEATRSHKGEILYTCANCGLERTTITPELSGCGGGGEGLFVAFLTNSAILLVWFVLKKKH